MTEERKRELPNETKLGRFILYHQLIPLDEKDRHVQKFELSKYMTDAIKIKIKGK